MDIKNINKNKFFNDFIMMTAGSVIMAISLYFFKSPNGFVTGGVGGLGIILGKYTTASMGLWLTMLNLALLILGFIVLGKSMGVRTIYCTLLYSGIVDLLEVVIPMEKPFTDQPMLELVCAIFLTGVGQALIFYADASSGGTDILALILKKHTSMDVGKAILVVDILISVASFFAFGIKTGLFSVLGLLSMTFVIDIAMESFGSCKYFVIITDKPDEIINFILTEMDHGATLVKGEGVYTHNEKAMLHTVCRRREAIRLQRHIKRVDPQAFTIITTSSEIIGSGFRKE
jgi:uncharacterized membrane-anchored protein YitT (DUF2179 family)